MLSSALFMIISINCACVSLLRQIHLRCKRYRKSISGNDIISIMREMQLIIWRLKVHLNVSDIYIKCRSLITKTIDGKIIKKLRFRLYDINHTIVNSNILLSYFIFRNATMQIFQNGFPHIPLVKII